MPLQKKFKNLISNLKSPLDNQKRMPWQSQESSQTVDVTPSQLASDPAVSKYMVHVSEFPNDPQADREALSSIEKPFYQDNQFDGSQFILQKLPDVLELNEIERDRDKLRRQLQAVSKKVSELVLENHPAYEKELCSVMELQDTLQRAGVICANGRRQLALARNGFTTASLGMLANYRRRQQLYALLKSLHTIKTLQQTDVRLREMLEEEEYAGAIQLCLECQKAASTFRHYHCISELSSKLQDTLLMIEEQLDVALSKICNNFDTLHYEKLQKAYGLLGKTQMATDQLLMHFTSAIHNTAFTIVLGCVELVAGTGDSSFQKKQYSDLCRHISHETFTPCLIDLCKALWEVMKSYHQAMEWHDKQNSDQAETSTEAGSMSMEALFNRRYIKQKLEHGLGRIWGDVQQKVKVYLLSTDLSYFKYDEFITVLDLVNRLMAVGEEFCGSKSEGLQDSIRKQSLNYFKTYHRSRLDELRMFLENEGWELCPVKSTFTILQLQEFKFLRSQLNKSSSNSSLNTSSSSTTKTQRGFFVKYGSQGNPFVVQNDEDENEEDVLATNGYAQDDSRHDRGTTPDSDSDSDVPDELKQDYIDERTGEVPENQYPVRKRRYRSGGRPAIIMTNTTLNVCRLFGKYMQMMSVLKPIAFDVTLCMSQLFDYYLYTVYTFFASDMSNIDDYSSLSSKLNGTLKRIHNGLILNEDTHQMAPQADIKDKVGHPHISPVVDLTNPDQLHGLSERVVAAESLVFLAEQFEFLQPHLENMIPPARKPFLQQFYSQTVNTAHELRKPVYRSVAARSIDYEQIYELMAAVRWDVHDLMSQHSPYVDVMLNEFGKLSYKLEKVSHRVPLPPTVTDILWDHVIRLTNKNLVEGFASAKKCTNEGRALMQLDFQQFLIQLEKITDLRPIPHRDYVEGYIKAYYLPEMPLEAWVREHKEYTPKQLMGLVNCIVHVNRKARSRILTMIEDMDRYRR